MLEKRNKLRLRILGICLLIGLLAATRIFENVLFYDPFWLYFRGEFASEPLPYVNLLKLVLSLILRYLLNSAISLGIIYLIFFDAKLTVFAAWLYFLFFILLISAFLALYMLPDEPHKMYLFYVRRFLIQPILLLLFVPAFYFQKLHSR